MTDTDRLEDLSRRLTVLVAHTHRLETATVVRTSDRGYEVREPTPSDRWEPTEEDGEEFWRVYAETDDTHNGRMLAALRNFAASLRERVPVPRVTPEMVDRAQQQWSKHPSDSRFRIEYIADHLNAALEARARGER